MNIHRCDRCYHKCMLKDEAVAIYSTPPDQCPWSKDPFEWTTVVVDR